MPLKFLSTLKSYERGMITEEEFCRLLNLPQDRFKGLMLALKAFVEEGNDIRVNPLSFDFTPFFPPEVPACLKPSFYDEVE